MEALGFSRTVLLYQTTRRCIPEDRICRSHHSESFRRYTTVFVFQYHYQVSGLLRFTAYDETVLWYTS
jgi:hypothetical protein